MCCVIRLTRCIVLSKKSEQANDAILEPDTAYRRRVPKLLTESVPRSCLYCFETEITRYHTQALQRAKLQGRLHACCYLNKESYTHNHNITYYTHTHTHTYYDINCYNAFTHKCMQHATMPRAKTHGLHIYAPAPMTHTQLRSSLTLNCNVWIASQRKKKLPRSGHKKCARNVHIFISVTHCVHVNVPSLAQASPTHLRLAQRGAVHFQKPQHVCNRCLINVYIINTICNP
jgi:hypothetical protein